MCFNYTRLLLNFKLKWKLTRETLKKDYSWTTNVSTVTLETYQSKKHFDKNTLLLLIVCSRYLYLCPDWSTPVINYWSGNDSYFCYCRVISCLRTVSRETSDIWEIISLRSRVIIVLHRIAINFFFKTRSIKRIEVRISDSLFWKWFLFTKRSVNCHRLNEIANSRARRKMIDIFICLKHLVKQPTWPRFEVLLHHSPALSFSQLFSHC